MRRKRGRMNRERFCGDIETKEVHDLDNEMETCRIEEIIDHGHDRPFFSLQQAQYARFYNLHSCVVVSDDELDPAYIDKSAPKVD